MKNGELKMICTNRRDGICDNCGEPVIGWDVKIETLQMFLGTECFGIIWERREKRRELSERPLLKGTGSADGQRAESTSADKPQPGVRVAS